MSTNQSTDAVENLILFSKDRPDAFGLSQLYNPDVDGTDPAASGKVVGTVNSLVSDEQTNIVYRISAVNPTTYKSTLVPIKIVTDTDNGTLASIIDYGTSRFMLYYDDRTKPTEINIDARLYVFNTSSVEYRLVRTGVDSTLEVVSLYYDADGNYKGNRIPLANVVGMSVVAKYCTNCHTLMQLTDGETIKAQLFDTNGVMTFEIPLIVKKPDALNDLASDGNPIIKFDADCLQMVNDEFYLHENQSSKALNIRPYALLADGTEKTYPIDGKTCFIYGLERDDIAAYPGRRFKILIKKFLTTREMTTVSTYDPTLRSVAIEKYINIIRNQTQYSLKLSLIPWYDASAKTYKFKYFAYTDERDHVYDVTNYVTVNKEFDPAIMNTQQYLKVTFDSDVIFKNNISTAYQQSWWITLRDPSNYELYIIKDSQNDEYAFGVDVSTQRRPIIHYDTTLKQYFVPTSIFHNKEAFIEAFYTVARPPYDIATEPTPVAPTHFTIRALDDANVIVSAPIPIDQYNQVWNISRAGSPDQIVGGTVIVEFLLAVGEEYRILYGVPVQVTVSKTGYNTDKNNIG